MVVEQDLRTDAQPCARGVTMAAARFKAFVGVLASGALVFGSTGASAASGSSHQQISPWATLSVLSGGAPAAAVCGAAAAVAAGQPAPTGCVLPVMDAPPPVANAAPPAESAVPAAGGYGVTPLLLGLAAIAVGVGLFLAVNGNGNGKNNNTPSQPNSPA